MSSVGPLTAAEVARFHSDGFLVVSGFYDRDSDLRPVQEAAHAIIALLRRKHGLAPAPPFTPETFDQGYLQLCTTNRAWGGEVYDAVKQIPAFVRLAAHPRNEALFRQLRGLGPEEPAGIAAGGFGIRIDNPDEERYRADWHQEYHAQLRSPDGITFWTSLVPVTEEMGPVRFCVGSHKQGMLRVHMRDPANPDKVGAYGLYLEKRDEQVGRFQQVAPLAAPGDLVVIDFAVLHASGFNRGTRARWSVQSRFFNFANPTGLRIGWRGSFAAGSDFRTLHPELVADSPTSEEQGPSGTPSGRSSSR